MTRGTVLNDRSRSGRSGIARCPQTAPPDPWPTPGTDRLADALPAPSQVSEAGTGPPRTGR
ncbi:hypothetical protein [Kitasatospora sp. NPDC097691]|uniref:phosphotransferase-like protein n=1 Tax=Kitasatospora sp. NPDC097691 TaxID=3157231 RepID=UPI003319EB9C